MKLSTNNRYQDHNNSHFGWMPFEVNNISDVEKFAKQDGVLSVFRPIEDKNHETVIKKPEILGQNYRNGDHWISCDWLFGDVDSGCSIEEFEEIFSKYEYYIITSRNHQKEKSVKIKGIKEKQLITCDRFHVLFPKQKPYKVYEDCNFDLLSMMAQYDFFDKSGSDPTRYWFGNTDAKVIYHQGEEFKPIPYIDKELIPEKSAYQSYNSYQFKDKKRVIMDALYLSKEQGVFFDYSDWFRLGMALFVSGFTCNDWYELSDSDVPLILCEKKWKGFNPKSISEGTIVYYARIGNPNLFSDINRSLIPVFDTTNLDDTPNITIIEKIKDQLFYYEDNGKGEIELKLASDWYYRIVELDPAIANCLKFDYTIGGAITIYDNDQILRDAIINRIQNYLTMNYITELSIDRIIGRINRINRNYSSVLAFIDSIIHKYGEIENPLDKVLQSLIFCDEENRKYYREILDKFFTRMHLHIDGTRRKTDGEYVGLIENDIVPILRGEQNIGKNTFCSWIGCGFHVDLGSGSSKEFGGEETIRNVRGKIIAELGEMKIMKTDENIETVKSFISLKEFHLTQKYREFSKPVPVTVSYIGSANLEEFLSDTSGNRRWYPINIKSFDKDFMKDHPEIAEMTHAYYAQLARKTEKSDQFLACALSQDTLDFIAIERDAAMIKHTDYGAIVEVVQEDFENKKTSGDINRQYHTIAIHEINRLVKIKGYVSRDVSKNSVRQAMKHLGYESSLVSIGGSKIRGWKKLFRLEPPKEMEEPPF